MKNTFFTKLITFTLLGILCNNSHAQCLNTNGDFETNEDYDITESDELILNTWLNDNLDNWKVSHGNPHFVVPGNGNLNDTYALILIGGTGTGDGAYTDFDFIADKSYRITYDLHTSTNNGAPHDGDLVFELSNDLTPLLTWSPPSTWNIPASHPDNQQIPTNPGVFEESVSAEIEFTADNDFSQLWLYSKSNVSGQKVVYEVDNICITEIECNTIASFNQTGGFFINTSTPNTESYFFDEIDSACCVFGFSSVTWSITERIDTGGPFTAVNHYTSNNYNFEYVPSSGATEYQVCLEVEDCSGCTDRICSEWLPALGGTGKDRRPQTEGTEDMNSENVIIYPNPNNGSFNVVIENFQYTDNSEMYITDLSGKKVMDIYNVSQRVTIEDEKLSSGTYIFVYKNANGIQSRKLLIQQ